MAKKSQRPKAQKKARKIAGRPARYKVRNVKGGGGLELNYTTPTAR